MSEKLLETKGITKRFGGVVADNDVSIHINKGEIVGLVGPNGCGKTTLFNCITGFMKPTEGTVLFDGEDITGKKPYYSCKRGIGKTFQLIKMLPDLTVLENVMIGSFLHHNDVATAKKTAEEIMDFLDFPGLNEKRNVAAKNLTTIDKKMLEIMRAVATKPKLLLLDEAMAGLNSSEVKLALDAVRKLRDSGITIIVIEHIMEVIMNISDRVIVMDTGSVLMEGSPEEVVSDKRVIKAYLGEKYNVESE